MSPNEETEQSSDSHCQIVLGHKLVEDGEELQPTYCSSAAVGKYRMVSNREICVARLCEIHKAQFHVLEEVPA